MQALVITFNLLQQFFPLFRKIHFGEQMSSSNKLRYLILSFILIGSDLINRLKWHKNICWNVSDKLNAVYVSSGTQLLRLPTSSLPLICNLSPFLTHCIKEPFNIKVGSDLLLSHHMCDLHLEGRYTRLCRSAYLDFRKAPLTAAVI